MSNADPRTLIDALSNLTTCMLISARAETGIDARPMTIAKVDDDGTIWMLTSADTLAVEQLEDAPMGAITAQGMTSWVFASGLVGVLDDASKAQSLWKEPFRIWFPDGPGSADLRVLRFTPKRAEVWTMNAKDIATFAYEAAKAWATGTQIDPAASGERASLTF